MQQLGTRQYDITTRQSIVNHRLDRRIIRANRLRLENEIWKKQ